MANIYKTAFEIARAICFPIYSIEAHPKDPDGSLLKIKGSAFFINKAGDFVTARHVVKELSPKQKLFCLKPGQKFRLDGAKVPKGVSSVSVSWSDKKTDIATGNLKLFGPGTTPIFSTSVPELGETLVSAGFPYVDDFRTIKEQPDVLDPIQTQKICLRNGPVIEEAYFEEMTDRNDGRKNRIEGFVADMQIYPGMSGGPCVNLKGEIAGINLSVITRKVTYPHFSGQEQLGTDLYGAFSGIECLTNAVKAAGLKLDSD